MLLLLFDSTCARFYALGVAKRKVERKVSHHLALHARTLRRSLETRNKLLLLTCDALMICNPSDGFDGFIFMTMYRQQRYLQRSSSLG